MQRFIVLFAFFLTAATALHARADDLFYVELGFAASQEEAANRWEDLVKAHRGELGGLQYYPVVIPETQSRISLRILGGPVETKEDAQKICSALFKKKAQCFVVEGMESPEKVAKRRAAEEKKRKAAARQQPLPWLVAEEEKRRQAEAEKEKPGFWGKLFGSDEEVQSSAAAPIAVSEAENIVPREAKVEVAEAIPVPVSNVSTGARPDFEPEAQMDETTVAPAKPAEEVKVETVGWLRVRSFDTEDNASAFWQNARGRNAALAAGLRVRITRPLMARGIGGVTLNIGPFGSESDANHFCEQAILSVDSMLTCSFSATEPGRNASASVSAYERGDDYQARRRQGTSQRQNASSEPYTPPKIEIHAYWVQLLDSNNQGEALEEWERIKTDHADLLRDYPSRISSSMGRQRGYSVKVGPIEMEQDATTLCSELQARGVNCKIYSNK